MRRTRVLLAIAVAILFVRADTADPLAAEISKWVTFLQSDRATGETWSQIKPGAGPVLTRAQDALRDGRRLLALQRYAAVRANLEAAAYASGRSDAEKKEQARFEAERTRVGNVLQASLRTPAADAFADIEPAAVRALAEIAALQVRGYYDASLEYSRNTMPETGLFYVGAAKAQRDFIAFARRVSQKTDRQLPAARALTSELDALERELLAAYRPPASIDKHSEFIGASSMLKEARELDAAGLRFGALLRYLDATRRTAQIRGVTITPAEVAQRLGAFETRVADTRIDHTIGQLLVETAHADATLAPVIVDVVLPRYFAALETHATPPKQAAPKVTVTLVRWPYT